MAEPTTRELYDIINEMRVDIGVMNTKMDFVMDSRKTAERAEAKADKALAVAEKNREDIRDMKANAKWVWGAILTVVGFLVTVGVAVFS